ncbi:MAG: hypothetical protein ACTHU0_00995 [Kofleriaceae bacterium]
MPLNDTIAALANERLTVTRTLKGTSVHGRYIPGSSSTFEIDAVVQPAYNLNRVIGGANLQALLDNQRVEKIYQIHTVTPLQTRSPTTDPDVIFYEGVSWTVARVEKWELDGEVHYHAVITKQTKGAS